MKYIRHDTDGFILFSNSRRLLHSDVVRRLYGKKDHILSAGFVYIQGGELVCGGASDSLRLAARDDDTAALRKQYAVKDEEGVGGGQPSSEA